MKTNRIIAMILSFAMALTVFAACDTTESMPEGSVSISPEESALISDMLESGMDESEIAEALSTMESTEVTEGTGETEPSAVESVAPNGETVMVTPTTAPRRTVTQTVRNSDGTTTTVRVTATATPVPTRNPNASATPTPRSTTAPTTTTEPTSTTTTARPTTAPSGSFNTSAENELVGLINNLRKTAAVNSQKTYYVPVQMRSTERNMAQTRAKEIVNNFSHTSASGISLASECIFKVAAPNYPASAIFNTWYNSGSHNAMLRGGATSSSRSVMYCGIGVWNYNGGTYAVYGTKGYESGTGLPSGYTPPATNSPTPVPTATTAPTPVPTATTAPTPVPTTPPETTPAETQAQNSSVDDSGDGGGDG